MLKKLEAYGIKFPLLGQTAESFVQLPARERFVLVAAWLCDVAKVRESGFNRGTWVERILRSIGLGAGNPWCAAFVSLCAELAEYPIGPKLGRGAVRFWHAWAKKENRLGFKPSRGDLCYSLNKDLKGHIEIVTEGGDHWVETIGGNTSADNAQELLSQREGDGVYRKKRNVKNWSFIRT